MTSSKGKNRQYRSTFKWAIANSRISIPLHLFGPRGHVPERSLAPQLHSMRQHGGFPAYLQYGKAIKDCTSSRQNTEFLLKPWLVLH
jgi:hypothetical protein